MIRLYVGRSASNAQAMEKIWRFRHEQFVERLGWEAIRRSGGLEIDQFDHDRAKLAREVERRGVVVADGQTFIAAEIEVAAGKPPHQERNVDAAAGAGAGGKPGTAAV